MKITAKTRNKIREIHRYLGFFLAGIMAVYAISGIVLIFRDTDAFKKVEHVTKQIQPQASAEELPKLLDIKKLKIEKEEGDILYFENGSYNKSSGTAEYTVKELPYILKKLTHLHKAKTKDPLFFLNVFFGLSLLFFVISAFFMFLPKMAIYKKGLYFTLGGLILTLLLLFL